MQTATGEKTKEVALACEYTPVMPDMKELAHKQRVANAVGVKVDEDLALIDKIQKLKDANFRLFVKKEDVFSKFSYHAGLKGSYGFDEGDHALLALCVMMLVAAGVDAWLVVSHVVQGYGFMGLALANVFWFMVSVGVSAGIFGGGRREINYVGDIPESVLTNMGKVKRIIRKRGEPAVKFTIHSASPLPVEEKFIKVDPVMVAWLNEEVGVVVGIWDADKEISVM